MKHAPNAALIQEGHQFDRFPAGKNANANPYWRIVGTVFLPRSDKVFPRIFDVFFAQNLRFGV